jgi:hypothetical protein
LLLTVILRGEMSDGMRVFDHTVRGVHFYGWFGYLILGFIGACILTWLARMVRGARTT